MKCWIVVVGVVLCVPFQIFGQEVKSPSVDDQYSIQVDLNNVENDRVKVMLSAPKITESKIDYIIPAVIPGSYSRKDYGRFIHQVKAFSKNGKKLRVKHKGKNTFTISKANELDHLTYWVEDTWDSNDSVNFVFQPGGTNIQADTNFVINHQGFWGYFEGYKMLPYSISTQKPTELYAETALQVNRKNDTTDVFYADSYVHLVDNPIMYSKPDTTSFDVGNMKVHISVYSINGLVTAEQMKKYISPLGKALEKFFGTLPVDHYHFIMYFPEYAKKGITKYGGFGALEHSYCSFYFLPELEDVDYLETLIKNVTAHEFLHILTPLNIHSEEIGYFDFKAPKMSQHLWLYEGVTEYFSNLVQIKAGLITTEDFLDELNGKVHTAATFPDVSFTEMSQKILSNPYRDMYINVYNKGALLAFFLDIRLQELSDGKKSLQDVMWELVNRYGPKKPFKDDALIPEIVALTYPEIQTFFDQYIIGDEPLPIAEYAAKLGFTLIEKREETLYSFGFVDFYQVAKGGMTIAIDADPDLNKFGLKNYDQILQINDEDVTPDNFERLLQHIENVTDGDAVVKVKFQRGEEQTTITAVPDSEKIVRTNILEELPDATQQQLKLRNNVLK
jgi:predicted metalloprotease with PDZ domain